ncbi:MAG: GIY-YIG nuclease family protein [Candidatus Thiodiazotropha sp.]
MQPKAPGTYVLVLHCPRKQTLRIGSLGTHTLPGGWYLYVGSAFGPGGVAARCGHHRRISVRPRWHIDYLRAGCRLAEIWYTHDPHHREHAWAGLLSQNMGLNQPVAGFGASDCGCGSHLFHSVVKPQGQAFRRLVTDHLPDHAVIYREID